jgi:hypothetical protein
MTSLAKPLKDRWSLIVASTAAAVLLSVSYHLAAGLRRDAAFVVFWAAMCTMVVPLYRTLVRPDVSAATVRFALVLYGVWAAIPKLLRSWGAPLYSDEFAHLVVVRDIMTTGSIDPVNPLVRMATDYPGLHLLVSWIASVTGLSPFAAGSVLVAVVHATTPLAVFLLARRAGFGASASAITALAYASNPSWLLFQSQLAYESLALPLLMWALVALTTAVSAVSPHTRLEAAITAAVLLAALAITHHLTSILTLLVLTVWSAIVVLRRRFGHRGASGETVWVLPAAAIWLAAVFSAWTWQHWEKLQNYLAPSLLRPYQNLTAYLRDGGAQTSSGGREPFSGSQLPWFEQIPGLLTPFVWLTLTAVAVWVWRSRRRDLPSVLWLAAGLSALYFVSLPALLTTTGAEGTRRTWAVTYLGLAFAAGAVFEFRHRRHLGDLQPVPSPSLLRAVVPSPLRSWLAALTPVFLASSALVLFVGGVATGQNEAYRFPGAWQVGNDARSLTSETAQVASFIAATAAPGDRVLADRYVRGRIALASDVEIVAPSKSFPAWDLTLRGDELARKWVGRVAAAGVDWLVVDTRMGSTEPVMGYWYANGEPRTAPEASASALRVVTCSPVFVQRFASEHYRVYRVDSSASPSSGGCEKR